MIEFIETSEECETALVTVHSCNSLRSNPGVTKSHIVSTNLFGLLIIAERSQDAYSL